MVANAQKSSAVLKSRSGDRAEERALMKLNRMFAKAAPLAARRQEKAMQRFQRELAAEIRRAS
jgi:hypothetical protein